MLFPSVRTLAKKALGKSSDDVRPTVKYVPEWFPGAGFKKFARTTKGKLEGSVNLPFQHVKESFQVCGTHLSCKSLTERTPGE